MKKFILYGILSAAGLAASCSFFGRKEISKAAPETAPSPAAAERTNPLWNSYSAAVGEAAFSLLRLEEQDAASGENRREFPEAEAAPSAFIGSRRYSLEDRRAVVFSFPTEGLSGTVEEESFDPAFFSYGMPAARWASDYQISSGPIAFADAVVVGTAEPALVVLDPITLVPKTVLLMDYLPIGRMEYDSAAGILRVPHGDGTVGFYGAPQAGMEAEDPVAAVIGPDKAALGTIAAELGLRFSMHSADGGVAPVVDPYGPRNTVPPAGPALFRYDAAGADQLRLYIDGAGNRPYGILIFDGAGRFLATNIEYAASAVLEYYPEAGAVYYIAVSFLDAAELAAEKAAVPRLIIAAKSP